jgi:hypothetical protein
LKDQTVFASEKNRHLQQPILLLRLAAFGMLPDQDIDSNQHIKHLTLGAFAKCTRPS